MSLTPDGGMEGWMRRTQKRSEYQGRRGNPFPGLTDLEDQVASLSPRNLLRNARGRINQRAAVSGTSLGSGVYFLDGWKSGAAANAVTWTGTAATGRVLTIPAGKSIQQPIEQADIVADGYFLAWSGTATARAYKVGAVAPSYQSVGHQVALDGTGDVVVEVGPGTLSWIVLVRGDYAPATFPDLSLSEDLLWCKRFFQAFDAGDIEVHNPYDQVALSGGEQFVFAPMVEMRAAPVVKNNSNVTPANSVFLCTYLSRTAASSGNLNVRITSGNARHLVGVYQGTDNGGAALSTNFVRGRNANTMWLDAEL